MAQELLHETDSIVRSFMPCVLEAAGFENLAEDLRNLNPIACEEELVWACQTLADLEKLHGTEECWDGALGDAIFWSRAALWSVVCGNSLAFYEYTERMRRALHTQSVPIH